MIGRIVKIVSKEYTLWSHGEFYDAIVAGKVRLDTRPVTGDIVEASASGGRCVIQRILPRYNRLARPAVANVDQALIVMSVADPEFSPLLIDRLSFLIVRARIKPILCVTKTDLGVLPETEARIREYESGPMPVIRCAKDHLDPSLAQILQDKITVLTGQSGAGKSTLLNSLDPSFHLETQEISKALGRGRHTTRHNELHEVAGGLVADTPGFSSLDFSHMDATELAQSVLEFQPYLDRCRFNDCRHQKEPGCAVKAAVEQGIIPRIRYEDYLNVLELVQSRKEKFQ